MLFSLQLPSGSGTSGLHSNGTHSFYLFCTQPQEQNFSFFFFSPFFLSFCLSVLLHHLSPGTEALREISHVRSRDSEAGGQDGLSSLPACHHHLHSIPQHCLSQVTGHSHRVLPFDQGCLHPWTQSSEGQRMDPMFVSLTFPPSPFFSHHILSGRKWLLENWERRRQTLLWNYLTSQNELHLKSFKWDLGVFNCSTGT